MKRIFRFLKALIKYALYGRRVSLGEYVERISKCDSCKHIDGEKWKCGVCGCYVDKKAKMSSENCPDGRW